MIAQPGCDGHRMNDVSFRQLTKIEACINFWYKTNHIVISTILICVPEVAGGHLRLVRAQTLAVRRTKVHCNLPCNFSRYLTEHPWAWTMQLNYDSVIESTTRSPLDPTGLTNERRLKRRKHFLLSSPATGQDFVLLVTRPIY